MKTALWKKHAMVVRPNQPLLMDTFPRAIMPRQSKSSPDTRALIKIPMLHVLQVNSLSKVITNALQILIQTSSIRVILEVLRAHRRAR